MGNDLEKQEVCRYKDSFRGRAASFALGFGIAIASCLHFHKNEAYQVQPIQQPAQVQPVKQEEYVTVERMFKQPLRGTKKAEKLWGTVKYELVLAMGKNVTHDQTYNLYGLYECIRDDDIANEERLERILEMVRDERSPVSKLLQKYKGPAPPPTPSLEDIAKLRLLYQQYEPYRRFLLSLIDEDEDNSYSDEEKAKAAYKLLHQ